MSANSSNLLVLPGDGIGPEVMAEVRTRHRLDGSKRGVSLRRSRRTWSAAPPSTRTACRSATTRWQIALERRCGAVRRGRRPEVGQRRLRQEARARPAAAAQGAGPVRQPAPGDGVRRAGRCLARSSPRSSRGLDIMIVRELTGGVYFGEPRGIDDAARRASAAASTPSVYTTGEIRRVARVAFELARKRSNKVLLGREGQRDGDRRAVARGGDQAAQGRIPGRRARAHVRRQLRHAAGALAQAVRRDRHRQPVRRHAVGRGRRC